MTPSLARAVVLGVAVSTVVAVIVGLAVALIRDDGQRATVVRVVDGDTLVVDYDDVQHRVRLLNVDTPETVDPGEPVQCLGPEATAYLEQRLPVGAKVVLRFDEDRLDRYDRELAGVFDADDVLVNAEIARAGLGVAVVFEPNRRFYRQVQEAQEKAVRREVGLYSSSIACTLPARVAELEGRAAALVLADDADLDALEKHVSGLARLAADGRKLGSLVRRPTAAFVAGTYPDPVRDRLAARVDALSSELAQEQEATAEAHTAEKQRVAAAQKAARQEAERIAREKAERIAREDAAKAREAREAAARAERRAETQREAEDLWTDTDSDDTDGGHGATSGGGAADTYTGCRAYGPGGTSVDDQGRRYTKIPC